MSIDSFLEYSTGEVDESPAATGYSLEPETGPALELSVQRESGPHGLDQQIEISLQTDVGLDPALSIIDEMYPPSGGESVHVYGENTWSRYKPHDDITDSKEFSYFDTGEEVEFDVHHSVTGKPENPFEFELGITADDPGLDTLAGEIVSTFVPVMLSTEYSREERNGLYTDILKILEYHTPDPKGRSAGLYAPEILNARADALVERFDPFR